MNTANLIGRFRQAAWEAAAPLARTELGARLIQRARPALGWVYRPEMRERYYRQFVGPYDRGLIQIDTRSHGEWSIQVYGGTDLGSLNLMKRLVHPGSVILDIGANIGQVTLALARIAGPVGCVHAFEPHPLMRDRLIRNIALNNLTNVIVCPDAMGSEPGEATLYGSITSNEGLSALAYVEGLTETPFPCRVDTVDNYVRRQEIARLEFVKIDTEGADFAVLQGAEHTLRSFMPAVYIEVDAGHLARFDASPTDIITILRDLGYELWRQEHHWEKRGLELTAIADTRAIMVTPTENWLAVHPARVQMAKP